MRTRLLKSIPKIKWNSTLDNIKNFEYQDNFFDSKEMYDLLVSFYKYGFVIIKNIPTRQQLYCKICKFNWKCPKNEFW